MNGAATLAGALLVLGLLLPDRAGAEAAAPKPAGGSSAPFGFVAFDSNEPISIRSSELEALSSQGERQLRFKGEVEVEQADVRITTDYLEAFYPEGVNQPDRLVAQGNVVLTQRKGEKLLRARCDRASYDRPGKRLVCRGNAELEQGTSLVKGKTIEFDLARDVVKVKGGASVLIQPKASSAGAPGQRAALGPAGAR